MLECKAKSVCDVDTDLYFVEISSDGGTNVFVGDDGTNSNQSELTIGIDGYGHPYIVWSDDRNTNIDVYYAGSTFVDSVALVSALVSASYISCADRDADGGEVCSVDCANRSK
jgi:hypothetical protein